MTETCDAIGLLLSVQLSIHLAMHAVCLYSSVGEALLSLLMSVSTPGAVRLSFYLCICLLPERRRDDVYRQQHLPLFPMRDLHEGDKRRHFTSFSIEIVCRLPSLQRRIWGVYTPKPRRPIRMQI